MKIFGNLAAVPTANNAAPAPEKMAPVCRIEGYLV
jgi:hypothetical protein